MRSRTSRVAKVAAGTFPLIAPYTSGRGRQSSYVVRTLPWSRRESNPQRFMVCWDGSNARQRRRLPGAEQPPKDHTRLEKTTWVPFSDGTCSVTS
jgi:hypothetical protein